MLLYCIADSRLNKYVTAHISPLKAPAILPKLLHLFVLTIVGRGVSVINGKRCTYIFAKEILLSRR